MTLLMPDEIRPGLAKLSRIERRSDFLIRGPYAYFVGQSQGARHSIMQWCLGGDIADAKVVTPESSDVRSLVQGYGGGACCVAPDGTMFYCDLSAGGLYVLPPDGDAGARCLGIGNFGDLHYHAPSRSLYAVEECEKGDQTHPVTRICRFVIDGDSSVQEVVVQGQDFYASPRVSPCGRHLCWVEWSHPSMPWDESQLWVCNLDEIGAVAPQLVYGLPGVSVGEPRWSSQSQLYFLQDNSGWMSLARYDGCSVRDWPIPGYEFGVPNYRLGARTYVPDGPGESVDAFAYRAGKLVLCRVSCDGEMTVLSERFEEASGLHRQGEALWFLGDTDTGATEPACWPKGEQVVSRCATGINANIPARIFIPGRGGDVHGLLLMPPQVSSPCPLVVEMHGGPTGMASAAHAPVHGYWCRMGMAVLQVNHRGSTGFGRRYRDALLGAWGIAEVEDCETLIDWLVQRRMVDPSRIAIRGSSAGGYTALRAATTSRRFAAATAAYGVADLRVLQHTTHKFESCYLEGLLGTSDPGSDAFVSRSPVNAKAVHCPVLMLHGCEDRIVPVEQSRLMVQRIQGKRPAIPS